MATKEMQQFLQKVDCGELPVMTRILNNEEPYFLEGIITQCDEWITEGWGCDNNAITPAMYAAALFNEALTQDEDVKRGESSPDYPKALRNLACLILAKDGHGQFYGGTRSLHLV